MKRLFAVTASCLLGLTVLVSPAQEIHDVSCIKTGVIKKLHSPSTIQELGAIVTTAQNPIAVAGGRFSQGGHIWYQNGIVIDMTKLNRIIACDPDAKTITVQAGARWRDIQRHIIPLNLSVKVMQSYNDFTVGGSLSVNAHGRDIAYGPLVDSVVSIKVMFADGVIVAASRTENADLFKGVIGGYGALGIIIEATLSLTDNYPVERSLSKMSIAQYKQFFYENIYQNKAVALHNANLYPDECNDVLAITWYKTTKPVTIAAALVDHEQSFLSELILQKVLAYVPGAKDMRLYAEQHYMHGDNPVVWRNYEMSATVASLEPYTRAFTTTILQEYFIPVDALEAFVDHIRHVIEKYGVNVLNISIRYVPQDNETILSYARQDCFSLVLFINMLNNDSSYYYVKHWTRSLINKALELQGTYYLPYQLFATRHQFESAYPGFGALRALKQQYDQQQRFSNSFLQKYIAC